MADIDAVMWVLSARRSELGFDDNEWEHLMLMLEIFVVFQEREKKYRSLWKQYGAVDSYQHVRSKAARVQFYLEGWDESDESDPFDLVNYTLFLIRNMRDGRIHGTAHSNNNPIAVAIEDIKAGDLVEIDPETGKIKVHTVGVHRDGSRG